MGRAARSESEEQIADLLKTAKRALRLSVAFLSRMDGQTQHLEVVESSLPLLFREKATQVQATSLCQAILDRKLPAVIPDLRREPEAMKLPAARLPRIRSYVSVPVRLKDGSLYGTLCAAGLSTDQGLSGRDEALMRVLAQAASVIVEPVVAEDARRRDVNDRLTPVLRGEGLHLVLQPIVRLPDGARLGAEALSRFPAEWGKAPDVVFAEAHSVGRGDELELLAIARAVQALDEVEGYVSLNVSPQTLVRSDLARVLEGRPLHRVLLELSEHDRVEDYARLSDALAPLRAQGMRLAIDDVGAGFSSLRHIVLTAPDVLKLDRSIVDGIAADHVLRTLARALADFAADVPATLVAEGVETSADAEVLAELGVHAAQGWLFGRPGPASALGPAVAGPAVAGTRVPAEVMPLPEPRVPWLGAAAS